MQEAGAGAGAGAEESEEPEEPEAEAEAAEAKTESGKPRSSGADPVYTSSSNSVRSMMNSCARFLAILALCFWRVLVCEFYRGMFFEAP